MQSVATIENPVNSTINDKVIQKPAPGFDRSLYWAVSISVVETLGTKAPVGSMKFVKGFIIAVTSESVQISGTHIDDPNGPKLRSQYFIPTTLMQSPRLPILPGRKPDAARNF